MDELPRNKDLKIWDNANIAESFPGIVLPLTFSIARRGYELVYKSQGYEAGLNWYQLEANHRTFNAMIGIFAGRVYYDLVNWYTFIGLFPNNSRNQQYLDEQLQTGGETIYLPPQRHSLRYRIRFWTKVARRALFFERERRRYWRYLDQSFQEYQQLSRDKDLPKLLERYAFLEQTVVPYMGRAADNDFFVMTYNGALNKRLRRWVGESAESKHDFLGALHDVISARQAILLTKIAENVKQDSRAMALLRDEDYQQLDAYLRGTGAGELLKEYRDKFLHRFAEDQKIEAVNPLLELSGFYALIKTYTQLDASEVEKRQAAALEKEQQRNQAVINQLTLVQKPVYMFLIKRLKHHLRIREHNRLLRGKVYALLRELFSEFGETMAEKKLIDQPGDVHYLDIEELFWLSNGMGFGDNWRELIKARKMQYESYTHIKAPGRFATKGAITQLPEEFMYKTEPDNNDAPAVLSGTIASPGEVEGRVMVLNEPITPSQPFDILVVNHTDPGWTPLIALAKGLIVEHGGILSHAAIVTRELGIPSVIGLENVTATLHTGQHVRLNATEGVVELL